MKTVFAGMAALGVAAGLGAQPACAFDLPKVEMPAMLGGSKDAPPAPGATQDCPVIVVEDGGHMLRSPAGADAAAVHHQVSIKSTARECIVEGDHVIIKVGIEGDVILGPAGAPGTYGGAIRIALRRTKDDSIVSTKTYRAGATIPAGAARADFQILADPIAAPPSVRPHDEFEILIGLTQGGAGDVEKPGGKKKKGRR